MKMLIVIRRGVLYMAKCKMKVAKLCYYFKKNTDNIDN